MAFIGIFILLALVLGFVAAIGLIIWALTRSKGSGSEFPTCGQCGYAVRGVGSLNCPECGADLREAGIIKPTKSSKAVWIVISIAIMGGLLLVILCGGLLMVGGSNAPAPMPAPIKVPTGGSAPATIRSTTPVPISPSTPGSATPMPATAVDPPKQSRPPSAPTGPVTPEKSPDESPDESPNESPGASPAESSAESPTESKPDSSPPR